jgi:hypothetical protein
MSGSESEAALGRQVERLAKQVVKNDAQVRSLAGALQRLTERVTAESPASPASPAGAGGAGEEPEPLPSWLTTTEFSDAAAMIEALEPWLAAVYLRFPNSELPTCWAWHPHVVEELWWLCQAWYDAYAGPKASWQKVGDWHDRQRPNVVNRLTGHQRLGSGCDLGQHVNWAVGPAMPLPDALPHILAAWCSPERQDWPPAPTPDQLADARRHEDAITARMTRPRR